MNLYDKQKSTVQNPWVSTDQSVDCLSVDSIIQSVIKEGMTDEEKVLALFNCVRRLVYHGDGQIDELSYDLHFLVNVTGHGSCLRQTTILAVLLDRLGYPSQNWTRNGHHLMQVYYGDAWHCLDPHMNFYVYDRSTPPKIASVQQLQQDPSLALDAVKEGRAGTGFLLCGDSPQVFAGPGGWVYDGKYPEGFANEIIREPFGNITLRRGETYIRTWMPDSYWHKTNCWMKDSGPYHTCLDKDNLDVANWPLYEPYGWSVGEGTAYRHWGAGKLVYRPNIAKGRYIDAMESFCGLAESSQTHLPALKPSKPDQPGKAVFSVNCPYAITAGELSLAVQGEGQITASVSIDQGRTWQAVEFIKDGNCLKGSNCDKSDNALKASFVDAVNGSLNGYRIKLMISGNIEITDMELVSRFQLNPYSLPHLVPGKNTVHVRADRYGSPLTVTYNWSEGKDWSISKSASARFVQDGSMEIETAQGKYPRVESLVLSVDP